MSTSKNIVFEGWLTKSPPNKRIWRTKWRRRWFALRQSGELPGQYILDYYSDRNCRRLKGTINLDLCEQVDAGLHMERGNGGPDNMRGCVFTIQTSSRVYHLEADTETDMERWVDAICRVCGLRAAENGSNIPDTTKSLSMPEVHTTLLRQDRSLYIPISECITGARAQDARAFTFDRSHVLANRRAIEKRNDISTQTPKVNVIEFSENESNVSDDDCKSLNTSDNTGRAKSENWSVAKSFTKLTVTSKPKRVSEDGPPVPPRPPKTFAMSKDIMTKGHYGYQGPRIQEPIEMQDIAQALPIPRTSRVGPPSPMRAHCSRYTDDEEECSLGPQALPIPRTSRVGPPSPMRAHCSRYTDDEEECSLGPQALPIPRTSRVGAPSPMRAHCSRYTDDDEEYSLGSQSMQYCNLPMSLPPVVDRNLKPRPSSHNVNPLLVGINATQVVPQPGREPKNIQYLDLDLPSSSSSKPLDKIRKKDSGLGKADEDNDKESDYKTVDFAKTEAFNITRQDAEASRNML